MADETDEAAARKGSVAEAIGKINADPQTAERRDEWRRDSKLNETDRAPANPPSESKEP